MFLTLLSGSVSDRKIFGKIKIRFVSSFIRFHACSSFFFFFFAYAFFSCSSLYCPAIRHGEFQLHETCAGHGG